MTKQQAAATKRVYGRPFPKGTSGNIEGRRIISHRFAELFDGLSADYGGPDKLSTFQRTCLAQACRLLMRSEKARDPNMQIRLSNAAMRALAAVQRGGAAPRLPAPKPPPLSLDEHLRQSGGGEP